MSTLAFLGPLGTFTHQAALALARPGDDLSPLSDIQSVYDAVESGSADAAVVAIDNTVEGAVVPSMDRILHGEVFAVARHDVFVTFAALAARADDHFQVAVSHPHALAQCASFVSERELQTRETTSTAAACHELAPGELAIAPRLCAEVYGLDVIAEGIEDFSGARTTFLRVEKADAPHATSGNRTFVAFTPGNIGPGALALLTDRLARANINILSLLTRPLRTQPGAYTFIVELEAALDREPLRTVLGDLGDAGVMFKILGSYDFEDAAESNHAQHVGLDAAPRGSMTSL